MATLHFSNHMGLFFLFPDNIGHSNDIKECDGLPSHSQLVINATMANKIAWLTWFVNHPERRENHWEKDKGKGGRGGSVCVWLYRAAVSISNSVFICTTITSEEKNIGSEWLLQSIKQSITSFLHF